MLNFQMESPTRIDDVTIISNEIKNVSNSSPFYAVVQVMLAPNCRPAGFQMQFRRLPNASPPSANWGTTSTAFFYTALSYILYYSFTVFLSCFQKKLKYVQFMIFETVIFQPEYFLFKLRLLIPTSPAASASSFPKLVPSPNS